MASGTLLGCLGSGWSLVGDLGFLLGVFDESVKVLFVLFLQRLDLGKQLALFLPLFVDISSVIFLKSAQLMLQLFGQSHRFVFFNL